MMNYLTIADWVLCGLGAVVFVVVVLRWAVASRRDPLAGAWVATNRLGPDGVMVPILLYILSAAGLGALVPRDDTSRATVASLWVGNAAQLIGALACLWVAGHAFDGGVRGFLGNRERSKRSVLAALPYLAAAMALCAGVYWVSVAVLYRELPNYQIFEHDVIVRYRSGEAPLWTFWIGTCVIAPVAEECFFRGIVQTWLVNVFGNRWCAVLLTAAVFGSVHAGGGDAPQPHVVPALTVLGAMLGVLYLRTGSLLGPMVFHALFNAKTLLWETLLMHGS